MATRKFKSAKEYFKSQPKETKENLLALKAIIKKALPNCEELVNYNIPAYNLLKAEKGINKL